MAVYVYQPYTHIQSTAASTWIVTHGFNRDVTVNVYDSSGNKIKAFVEKVSDTQLRIKFYEKGAVKTMTGRAVIG